MACPLCGEQCTCSYAQLGDAGTPSGEGAHVAVLIDPESFEANEQQFAASLEGPAPPAYRGAGASPWRQEVATRLDAYRARRGRKRFDANASLRLDFEEPPPAPVPPRLERVRRERERLAALEGAGPHPAPEPAKVIEFPRPVTQPLPFVEELAEPILDKPRILEAEELPEDSGLQFSGVPMPSITLEPEPERSPREEAEPAIEVAPLSQRILSGMVDGMVVLLAGALFAWVFLRMAGTVPMSRLGLTVALIVPAFFWAVYHYLFLVHAGATPGMQIARLRLSRFDGWPARRNLRRWRAAAMIVSCMSLGLGFIWAAIDEQELCWHDRITKTYLKRI